MRNDLLIVAVLVALLPGAAALAQPADPIWIEGEDAARADVVRHPGWYDRVVTEALSGGQWLSNFSDQRGGEAEYKFDAPSAGRYTLWVRANPVQAGMTYRVNAEESWHAIDMDNRQRGHKNIAVDAKPDLRYVAWASAGAVELREGANTLTFRLDGKVSHHGALDCFVLTTGDFVPTGIRKPGVRSTRAEPGTWAFDPDWDRFSDDAVMDLRSLNEATAGENGFVRLSNDGESLLLGDGTPARFWSVTSYGWRMKSQADYEHHMRFLAKRGVNMVRLHLNIPLGADGQPVTAADPNVIDQVQRTVAAAKKFGIYTTVSPYWSAHQKRVPERWGIAGWPVDRPPFGLVFFNPKMQTGYRAWMKQLFTAPNPHTGTPLAQEPSLAVIQLQNEDSLLFFTEHQIKGTQRELLGEQFYAFLVEKHGSFDKARQAWGGGAMKEDRPADKIAGLYIIWEMTQPQTGAKQARLADQLEFYTRTMRTFNVDTASYLRDELGCKQLINAGNWITASPVLLDDAERWSYLGNEVVAANRYFSAPHVGEAVGWSIRPGHFYADKSVLRHPLALPVSVKQLTARPYLVTESQWVPPNAYQAEGPFLVAAYSSLSGVDSFYWFGVGVAEWSLPMGKWDVATPMQMGQFPAAALMFRKGYIKQGQPVVDEHRALDDLWQRRTPIIAATATYDPNRDTGDIAPDSPIKQGVDPLAFLVGPVMLTLESDPAKTHVTDLKPFIDHEKNTVISNTAQLRLNHANGLLTLDAPRAQGAVGFLNAAGPIELADIAIASHNDYASVLVVPLDDRPIATSQKLLVQVGTSARPYGWKTEPATFESDGQKVRGHKIVAVGGSPWNVVETDAVLLVKNAGLSTTWLLDENGYRRSQVPVTRTDAGVKLTLPAETMYLVIEK